MINKVIDIKITDKNAPNNFNLNVDPSISSLFEGLLTNSLTIMLSSPNAEIAAKIPAKLIA